MDSTNQFSREVDLDSAVQQQPSPANSVVEELNELELDAIAGGRMYRVMGDRFGRQFVDGDVLSGEDDV